MAVVSLLQPNVETLGWSLISELLIGHALSLQDTPSGDWGLTSITTRKGLFPFFIAPGSFTGGKLIACRTHAVC